MQDELNELLNIQLQLIGDSEEDLLLSFALSEHYEAQTQIIEIVEDSDVEDSESTENVTQDLELQIQQNLDQIVEALYQNDWFEKIYIHGLYALNRYFKKVCIPCHELDIEVRTSNYDIRPFLNYLTTNYDDVDNYTRSFIINNQTSNQEVITLNIHDQPIKLVLWINTSTLQYRRFSISSVCMLSLNFYTAFNGRSIESIKIRELTQKILRMDLPFKNSQNDLIDKYTQLKLIKTAMFLMNRGWKLDASVPLIFNSCSISDEENICSICRCDIDVNNNGIVLKCSHMYHPNCLEEHIIQQGPCRDLCPLCRQQIKY